MKIFASDLDNTLIYSYKRIFGNAVCVEIKDEKELSYMTQAAHILLKYINEKILFVPVTTRSLEQYKRLKLLSDTTPKLAIVSNGGILLRDNEIDKDWYNETLNLIENCTYELYKAIDILQSDKNVFFEPRMVDKIFAFAKTRDFIKTQKNLLNNIDVSNLNIEQNREKVYVIPKCINKGNALKRLKETLDSNFIISAGDSSFDIPMKEISDIFIYPKNDKIIINPNNTIFF